MKFLCICNQGNCRSYAMARILKYLGHEAINIGMDFTDAVSLSELGVWADAVIILTEKPEYIRVIEDSVDVKIFNLGIGRDKWGNPFNKELTGLLYKRALRILESYKLLNTIDTGLAYRNIFSATAYG